MERVAEALTPPNVQRGLALLFCVAGAPRVFGLANASFESDMGYPAWFAMLSGLLEAAAGVGLYIGGEHLRPASLMLQVIMGGGVYTMLRSPTPPAALFPALCAYGLWYVQRAARFAVLEHTAAALALGVVSGVLLNVVGPKKGGKKAPAKKAATKKSK